MRYQMKNSFYIFIFSVIIGFVVSGLLFRKCCRTPEIIKTDTITKTDTMWKTDTFKLEKLIPQKIVEIKKDTLYKKDSTEVILVTENKEYKDTISTNDGDSIILNNFISGINPQLDSTKVSLKKKEVINTIEITKYVEKKKTIWNRFSLGVGIGYGIGLKNKDLEPFVGVSIVYNLEF